MRRQSERHKSLDEVGKRLESSKEHARQIEEEPLEKLKVALEEKGLAPANLMSFLKGQSYLILNRCCPE